jgi:hypothetical protein
MCWLDLREHAIHHFLHPHFSSFSNTVTSSKTKTNTDYYYIKAFNSKINPDSSVERTEEYEKFLKVLAEYHEKIMREAETARQQRQRRLRTRTNCHRFLLIVR